MPVDPKFPLDPSPRSSEQIMAELLRETERLRRQVTDAQEERDQFKQFYLEELARNAEDLTPQDIANAVPARPLIDAAIKRLEQR